METKQLSLNSYLQLCVEFEEKPTPETEEALRGFVNSLEVKEYLPLTDKALGAAAVLSGISDDFDAFGAASFIEIGKLFHGLLHYAINLNNDIGMLDRTYTAYDLCYKYGLADAILQRCEKDYRRFCDYIDHTINTTNAYRLIQTASLLNTTDYASWMETMQEVKQTFTPELLKSLEGLNISGSKLTEDLVKVLAQGAVQSEERALQQELEKFTSAGEDFDRKFSNDEEAFDNATHNEGGNVNA